MAVEKYMLTNMAVKMYAKYGCERFRLQKWLQKIQESQSRYIALLRKYIVNAVYRTFYFTFRDCHWFSLIFLNVL